MTNILFDIMYTIMMTTTLSIIGFYGARFTLAVTLYIFDKLLQLIAMSNSSDGLPLPLPPPGVDELLIDLMVEYRRLLLSFFLCSCSHFYIIVLVMSMSVLLLLLLIISHYWSYTIYHHDGPHHHHHYYHHHYHYYHVMNNNVVVPLLKNTNHQE